jgi:2-polyprenyl-3-methyl-5-hydroxy-6-metoxy-1,4-benzoquinol methylase
MTIEYYQRNANTFFESTKAVDMSDFYQLFTSDLPKGGLILDAGCGSGRDTKSFLNMGYRVEAFDASSELALLASELTGIEVKTSKFEYVSQNEIYDGIWCCASLLHVPLDELPQTLGRLTAALKPKGVLYMSFKYGDTQREVEGRLFTDMNEARLTALLKPLTNFSEHQTWVTHDKRPDRADVWLNVLLKKS